MSILGQPAGGFGFPKTYVLTDSDGNELTAVYVSQEQVFDATVNDVREGKVYAGDEGVKVGEKVIPSYHTNHGARIIPSGSEFTIRLSNLDCYDYTKLHCIICTWNTSLSDSVAADKIVVLDMVYPVQSTESIASVTKDHDAKNIVLGITNNTENSYVLRYMTFKEIE